MADYQIRHTEDIISPALIYYRELFIHNLEEIIRLAGGAERLWPHAKTHKCAQMVKLQISRGVKRFKCATVAELEMVCAAGAEAAILAMAPAGPTPKRLIALQKAYPQVRILGIADCEYHLRAYGQAALSAGVEVELLLDVNMGMDRTGVPTEKAAALYRRAAKMPGVRICGFHCYDGNRHEADMAERQGCVDRDSAPVFAVREELQQEGYSVELMVMGGSASLSCHTRFAGEGVYYSPGTILLQDDAYAENFPELRMIPAAAILCRVISHPCEGTFTLDLGYKGIAGDPPATNRGVIVGLEHCRAVMQNEEHWVFRMDEGFEEQIPPVGSVLYVIPRHVCPCAMLYPSILIAEGGEIVDEWEVTARNRKITF